MTTTRQPLPLEVVGPLEAEARGSADWMTEGQPLKLAAA